MFRRHPILTLLGLLSVTGLLWVVYFLATFDLNLYRDELQVRLSNALSQPVRLGTASLSLRPGPTFDFTTIEIGSKEDRLLEADRLSLQTNLLPLLIGKLSFEKIVLHRPRVRFTLLTPAEKSPTQARPVVLLSKLLNSVRVHSLQIEQGTINLNDLRQQNTPFELQLTGINLNLRDVYSRQKSRLQLSGQLAGEPASRLEVAGRLALPTNPALWRQLWLDLSVHLKNIDPNGLCSFYAAQAGCSGSSGRLTLDLALHGSPEEGLSFKTDLQGENLLLKFPEHYPQPLNLQKFGFSGQWTADTGLNKFDDLTLHLNELQLAGHFSLQHGEADPWLEGGLSTQKLPLSTIADLLPATRAPFSHLLEGQTLGGTLRLGYSRFAGPLSQFQQQALHQTIKEATLYLEDGQFRFGKSPLFTRVKATATWQQQRLSLNDGTAQVLESPLQFSGTIDHPFQPTGSVTFGAGWVLPGRNLAKLFDNPKLQPLTAEGPILVSFNMGGLLSQLQWSLQADLQACSLRYEPGLAKPAGMPSGLKLQGLLTSDELKLTASSLKVGPLELKAIGYYKRQRAQDYLLRMTLTDTDLATWLPLIPALEPFQLRGQLSGEYSLQGSGSAAQQGEGVLSLTKCGVHFPKILGGDLQNFSGNLKLFSDHIEWQGVKGLLGKSKVSLGGQISNWSKPRIELNLNAKKLRANELIFPSPKATLHNLKGSLVFVGKQVNFNDLHVTLDSGTQVAVSGILQGGKNPELNLTARAGQADIDSVVALWQAPRKPARTPKKNRLKVVVKAEVAKGTYQGLLVEQATTTVTSVDGVLRLSPLRFHTGGGSCLAQIALHKDTNQNRLLTVSGQIKGVEASTLQYGKVLGEKGLLSGALDGDFQLTGELGANFLPTADGGFQLTIKEGVLRKFTFLAKVFSLLNVSQILTLQLPDMVEEGMPFSSLEGGFVLRDGVLTTEDLLITSNAMNLSLVGDINLVNKELDLILGVKPFGTVDKLVTHIPVAGWLLTGKEKALITAHFEITGPSKSPKVLPVPVTSVSTKVLGIFKRVLGLPGKLITDPGEVITGQPAKPAPQGP
ncbi:hypothetical protein A7E78_12750 [Syntrophotalea acetylenivorans]|uniref:YhdP central domain-containing protein n=1 Tax=Syntrophotalea acetylenivorans TaxID=1842532 RepID=A0A1L3GRT4_9BACT|nr:AsmA-like C-terminal domain-containing protein [Syntrophotalea acetylenivorans]APG28637.1 hypothetical protein A7E78_12750 [Syntrophotalea acetylenivorans]